MIYAVLIAWVIKAYFDAKEEVALMWPFRENEWDVQRKMELLGIAHKTGAAGIASLLLLTGLLYGWKEGWLSGALAFLLAGFAYWLVFDIVYAKAIGKEWHYLGDTAETDKIVRNGKVKALVCLVIIATILTLFIFIM